MGVNEFVIASGVVCLPVPISQFDFVNQKNVPFNFFVRLIRHFSFICNFSFGKEECFKTSMGNKFVKKPV